MYYYHRSCPIFSVLINVKSQGKSENVSCMNAHAMDRRKKVTASTKEVLMLIPKESHSTSICIYTRQLLKKLFIFFYP